MLLVISWTFAYYRNQMSAQGCQSTWLPWLVNMLCLSYFCKIWILCRTWITYDKFYYASCLTCWALFWFNGINNAQQCTPSNSVTQCTSLTKRLVSGLYFSHITSAQFDYFMFHGLLIISYTIGLAYLVEILFGSFCTSDVLQ